MELKALHCGKDCIWMHLDSTPSQEQRFYNSGKKKDTCDFKINYQCVQIKALAHGFPLSLVISKKKTIQLHGKCKSASYIYKMRGFFQNKQIQKHHEVNKIVQTLQMSPFFHHQFQEFEAQLRGYNDKCVKIIQPFEKVKIMFVYCHIQIQMHV